MLEFFCLQKVIEVSAFGSTLHFSTIQAPKVGDTHTYILMNGKGGNPVSA